MMTAAQSHKTGVCEVCGREQRIVNYSLDRGTEFGYLARHWRPGIPRTSKCRGSFGAWVKGSVR